VHGLRVEAAREIEDVLQGHLDGTSPDLIANLKIF
jgi:hypothetical protein